MTDTPPPPALPPRWRRLYAHVMSLELACPRCGRIHVHAPKVRGGRIKAYDRVTGIFKCPPPCGYRGYVGVVLWPATGRSALAADHVPTPGEAARLREAYAVSAATEEAAGLVADVDQPSRRHRAVVNVRCTCGEGCPVHAAGVGIDSEGEDHETDD